MKSTKKSLLLSTISLVLCFAMLLGTTWAWFTDEVTSGKNQIVAGNLDVELTHSNSQVTNETVKDATDLFSVALWEPGVVAYENFTVKNAGTLAFKYTMVLSKWNFNTVKDTDKSLADVIKVAIVPGGYTPATSGDARAALLADSNITFNSLVAEGTNDLYKIDSNTTGMGILYPANNTPDGGKTSETFGVILYWEPSDIDNDYNLNNGKQSSDGEPLFLDLGINLVATQLAYESDSFNNQYDKDTVLPVIGTKTQTVKKSAEGTYTFENDKYVEGEQQKQAPSTVIPAETTFYTSHEKTEENIVAEATDENVSGELNRKVETSKEYIAETQKTIIDLDISFTYTTKTTSDAGITKDTQDVKAFSNVIEYSSPIGKGFALQMVTHNGVAMTPAEDMTDKADQTFYYDYNTGILYVWSSTFSVFEAVGVDCVAFIEREGVMVPYNTLSDAFNDQKDGETVVLMKTVTGSDTTWQKLEKGNYTLDLNGCNIVGPEVTYSRPTLQIHAAEGSTMKITDSSATPGAIINYRNTPPVVDQSGNHIQGALFIKGFSNGTSHIDVTIENISIINTAGQSAITNNVASSKESLVIKSGKIQGDIYLDLYSGGDVVVSVYDDVEYTGTTKFIASTSAHKVESTDNGDYVTYKTVPNYSNCDLLLTNPATTQGATENTWASTGTSDFLFSMSNSSTKYYNAKICRDISKTSSFSFGITSVTAVTLDLNGKSISTGGNWTVFQATKYDPYRALIITDSSSGDATFNDGMNSYYGIQVKNIDLTINGGNYTLSKFNLTDSTVTINAGTFTVPTTYVETLKTYVTSGSTVTINGESYTAP